MPALTLSQVLFSQGFGTRRECEALIRAGRVQIDGTAMIDAAVAVDTRGLQFSVDGVRWPYHARAVVALNKPAGYECSQKPSHHPSVLSLLPPPLRARGVQPVGRLDVDSTGLLLLTDDGALIHRLTSPRRHVAKVYEVQCAAPVNAAQIALLEAGVVLRDEPQPVRATDVQALGERTLM
ncbi:MAG: pseudouridine synthase, partial [Betaproteobacteria bacterium]